MARLVTMAGLPASGKSTIARGLAVLIDAVWLRVDSMDQAIWASGTAPADLRDWTYRAAQAVAIDNLALGRDVIADCVNDCMITRKGWLRAALQAEAQVVWIEVICSDAIEHRRRAETRISDVRGLRLPDREAILSRSYDSWDTDRAIIDTAHRTVDECLASAMSAIQNHSTGESVGGAGS